jgi:hypothetical protein
VTRCNLCTTDVVEPLVDFGSHPIAHHFLERPDEEEYRHPVVLGFCTACGLAQLIDPIPPERLYSDYHWFSSWKRNPHVGRLLARVEGLPGLAKDAHVLEVGSNDGSFLLKLRERGHTRLLGLEPAEDARREAERHGIETFAGYFTPTTAQVIVDRFGRCDLLVARQVLEHVNSLGEFAEAMRVVLEPGAHVLVEVPDFAFNQRTPDYSAVWEEHVNHFTPETLARFLADAGVVVETCETALFSGQILIAFGRYVGDRAVPPAGNGTLPGLRTAAAEFGARWPAFRASLRDYLEQERHAGRQLAVYGAGCRSATLINFAGMGDYLEWVLDDQPEKQGKYMPGSRLPILPGERLAAHAVDTCLLAVNAENEDMVVERHAGFLEQGGRFASIHPPSPRLPEFWTQV